MGMVTCVGSVLTSLWLLSEKVLSFMTLSIWIRLVGRDAFFGMVGCLPCLVLMGVWFWMGFLVLELLGVVFTPMHLVLLGLVGGGDIWTCFLHCLMMLVRLVDCIVPFLVLGCATG